MDQRKQRAQNRSCEAGEQRERCEVAEQDVLRHVQRLRALLAVVVHGRSDRNEEECESQGVERDPPGRWRLSARAYRSHALRVERRQDDDGHELQGLERPVRHCR